MRYYEVLINELFPAGLPPDPKKGLEGIEPFAPEKEETIISELPESLCKLKKAIGCIKAESRRELGQVMKQLAATLSAAISDEAESRSDVAREVEWTAAMLIGDRNIRPPSVKAWKSQTKIRFGGILETMFWSECESYIIQNRLLDVPPSNGIGVRLLDDKVYLVARNGKPNTDEEDANE